MARSLLPFVQNGYYASRNWIPLVKGNGFTTSGGGEQEKVWKTASGPIVTFDAVAAPLRQLSVAVEPVQSGTGDPSPTNVRPITGWNSVTVNRKGKNLLPKMVAGTYTSSGITVVVDDTGVATVNISTGGVFAQVIIPLESGIVVTQAMVDGAYYHLNNTLVHPSVAPTLESAENLGVMAPTAGQLNRIVGIPATAVGKTINRIRFWVSANVTASGTYAPAFMLDSTATAYEPYQGNEYTIQLGETVYGGTLDVVNGKMTVDRAMVDLGTQAWTYLDAGKFRCNISGITEFVPGADALPNIVCSAYKPITARQIFYKTANGIGQSAYGWGSKEEVYVIDSNITVTTGAEFKALISGVQLVYPLATPFELTLTLQQIATLQGVNNVWSDAGDVTVDFAADIKTYIDNKIAAAVAALS